MRKTTREAGITMPSVQDRSEEKLNYGKNSRGAEVKLEWLDG